MISDSDLASRPFRRGSSRFALVCSAADALYLAGLGLQAELSRELYVIPVQAALSAEASLLLNRWITWRDQPIPFGRTLAPFSELVAFADSDVVLPASWVSRPVAAVVLLLSIILGCLETPLPRQAGLARDHVWRLSASGLIGIPD